MNFRYPGLRPLAWALAIGLTSNGAHALTLREAMRAAERDAPSLAAQAAEVEAARNDAIPAGELPDPKLLLGLQNFPINGPDSGELNAVPMTFTKIGVKQQMINSDKRKARVDSAHASVERASVKQQVERLKVRRETALAWISTLAIEQKIALFKTLYTENQLFSKAVKARLASGKGQTADSVAPKIEAALLEEQEDQLRQQLVQQRAALRRWVGVRANEQLTGPMPNWPVDAQHYKHNLDRHPNLAVYGPMTSQAEARLREAQAEKKSDWSWEVAYQNRDQDFGDLVSLQVSIDLPIFSGSRQDPKIAARRSALNQIEAQREAQLRAHIQQLEDDLASYRRLDRALTRNQMTLIPLAEDKVKLSMADYRAARNQLSTVISARQELIAAQLKQIDIKEQRALASARLYFTDLEAGL
ncbi:TolC family protein [Pseudomonas sp. NPDC078700]|uniref:TolC family protein n=1 Tax=Pseudomonas sp. NPDC078700 TaxID=3364424 RepID=UPI0037CC1FF9